MQWFLFNETPPTGGKNGDWAFVLSSAHSAVQIWHKVSGAWVQQFSLTGGYSIP